MIWEPNLKLKLLFFVLIVMVNTLMKADMLSNHTNNIFASTVVENFDYQKIP